MKPNEPFKIRAPIGSPYTHDLDDVTRTKHALKTLGHFKTPGYGLTSYPDAPLFDGIKSYQRSKGLDVDGVVKPGGPTAAQIGKDLSDKPPKFPTFKFEPETEGELPYRPHNIAKSDVRTGVAFNTTGDVGWGRTNDPDDILTARRALAWAKQLPASKAKDQKSADNDLFQAIENFQSLAGVKKDGWIRPGGETARALDKAIAPKVQAYLKAQAGEDDQGGTAIIAGEPTPSPAGSGPTADEEELAMSRRPDSEAQKEIDDYLAGNRERPTFRMERSRQEALRKDWNVRFNIEDNPNETGDAPKRREHGKGVEAVRKYDAIIEREAKRQGVDPDLVRAVMYTENADGSRHGVEDFFSRLGLTSSLMPMNIQPKTWAGIGGVMEGGFGDPAMNIRAGVALLKRIKARIDDPTPAKIGSIWNFAGREKVNSMGARIGRAYAERLWLRR